MDREDILGIFFLLLILLLVIIWIVGNVYLSILSFDDYSNPDEKKRVYNSFEINMARIASIMNFIPPIILFILYIYGLYGLYVAHKSTSQSIQMGGNSRFIRTRSINHIVHYLTIFYNYNQIFVQ